MKLIKYLLIALLVLSFLASCKSEDVRLQSELKEYSQIIMSDSLDRLHLTIYYIPPSLLTRKALTAEELINHDLAKKIVVDGEKLKAHSALLKQLNLANLERSKHSSHVDARLCYMFETDQNERVLEITVGGENNSIFVNGVEVAYCDVFRNLLEPFVTEDVMDDFEYIFSGRIKG